MSELSMFFMNKLNEECGVFGVFGSENASELTYYGLHALQHRGQEGCGIVTSDGEALKRIKGEGLVTKVFDSEKLNNIKGIHAIGHVRYSTAGGGGIENVQPFLFKHSSGDFGLAHNGNLVNSDELKMELEKKGSIFGSTSDSEILAHLIKGNPNNDRFLAITEALNKLEGAFAFLLLTNDHMYIIRDKHGLRPLALGRLDDGGYVVSSETCAFSVIGATYLRDIEAGEVLILNKDKTESFFYSDDRQNLMCAMEYIYFSRPDSDIENINIHKARKETGIVLFEESDVKADIVIGVPDSSISAAVGYSEASGIPYEFGLIKNKYIARTFIQPSQQLREQGVKMKLSAVASIVNGKDVILVDDSIVRGTTMKRIIKILKNAGAKKVHVRIASPQIKHPCYYGVDTSNLEELISAKMPLNEIQELLEADSLYFISEEGLKKAFNRNNLCLACFNGNYPTKV